MRRCIAPGAFMTGFAVCLLELPCTGGLYLFILPQILITLLVYLGLSPAQKIAD